MHIKCVSAEEPINNKESGKKAVCIFVSVFHRHIRGILFSTIGILDGWIHPGFFIGRRLRGSLGLLPEKRNPEKSDQHRRRYADFIQYPDDTYLLQIWDSKPCRVDSYHAEKRGYALKLKTVEKPVV